ncbi:MAG: polynucleotide adenylyltransferase PcnB [Pseudomonadota bacterium]
MIYPPEAHGLVPEAISPAAREVLQVLHQAGYQACLVGGGVRDLLLGRQPKDFDVTTNATPEQVQALFRRCRLIGRRFRLAHVFVQREQIEVATFRSGEDAEQSAQGMIVRDNRYGTIAQDALRRDFTLNALYFNSADGTLTDYAGGLPDLRQRVIRLIGDPHQRYTEDPVRLLRAVRFAVKLDCQLVPETEAPLWQLGHLLSAVPAARLTDEVLKLFMAGAAVRTFQRLDHYGLLTVLFRQTADRLAAESDSIRPLIEQGLRNSDQRVAQGLPITPAFLFAVLLWAPVQQVARQIQVQGAEPYPALHQAADRVLAEQNQMIALPRRFSAMTRDIWAMQFSFKTTKSRRAARLVRHPRFRAAYDFMLLRAQVGDVDRATADWWTRYQEKHGPAPSRARRHRRQ